MFGMRVFRRVHAGAVCHDRELFNKIPPNPLKGFAEGHIDILRANGGKDKGKILTCPSHSPQGSCWTSFFNVLIKSKHKKMR